MRIARVEIVKNKKNNLIRHEKKYDTFQSGKRHGDNADDLSIDDFVNYFLLRFWLKRNVLNLDFELPNRHDMTRGRIWFPKTSKKFSKFATKSSPSSPSLTPQKRERRRNISPLFLFPIKESRGGSFNPFFLFISLLSFQIVKDNINKYYVTIVIVQRFLK